MLYTYEGPIYRFNALVYNKWEGATQAPSLAKASNNFRFKAKNVLGLANPAGITIDKSKIKQVKE